MGFSEIIDTIDRPSISRAIAQTAPERIKALLAQERIQDLELPLLFSPAAADLFESIADKASSITAHRFGRVVNLYAPLYLSNHCVNNCLYCGFARRNKTRRVALSAREALAEAQILLDEGFRHLLLVTGEAPRAYALEQLEEVVRGLAGRFASIGIEVFPMNQPGYSRLAEAGVDNLTLYQETYDRETYARCHDGPKADFDARLAAIEAGGKVGFRTLGLGALLGLAPWREEVVMLVRHGRYLSKHFWRTKISFSFPRLRPAVGGFVPPFPVDDREFAQLIVGLRLAMPDAEIVLSTREPAALRDALIPFGVTRMSAGSKTNPGGYRDPEGAGRQFDVHDERSPQEVARAIEQAGREPVWKDFDRAFLQE